MDNNEMNYYDDEIETTEVEVIDSDEENGFNVIPIVAAVAGVGAFVGGVIAIKKKLGGKISEKIDDVQEKRILRRIDKLESKYVKIQIDKEKRVADAALDQEESDSEK